MGLITNIGNVTIPPSNDRSPIGIQSPRRFSARADNAEVHRANYRRSQVIILEEQMDNDTDVTDKFSSGAYLAPRR